MILMSSKIERYDDHDRIFTINAWQDYDGVKWSEWDAVYEPDHWASRCYLNGKQKPKSLFFRFNYKYKNKYLNKLYFFIHHYKYTNELNYPKIKVFRGDNNAPYKKQPLFTLNAPTKITDSNNTNYKHLYYQLDNINIGDLEELIVECDYSKCKVNYATQTRVGYTRLDAFTQKSVNNIVLTQKITPKTIKLKERTTIVYTATQKGTNGKAVFEVRIPPNCKLISASAQNKQWDKTNGRWTVDLNKGEKTTLSIVVEPLTIGTCNIPVYKGNVEVLESIIQVTEPESSDGVSYGFYESRTHQTQYFDVYINGESYHTNQSFILTTSPSICDCPLYSNAIVCDDSFNIVKLNETNNKHELNFDLIDLGKYYLHLKIPYFSNYPCSVKVTTIDPKNIDWIGEFVIEEFNNVFDVSSSDGSFENYSSSSVNIGVPNVWTIRCNAHRSSYSQINDGLLNVDFEESPAYIGSVRLNRCHSRDATANVSNTLIRDRYLDRAYYGKKGDYTETISMHLRIPPKDVATLEGFVEYDKPVPIDTRPNNWDGDPLGHRGWAELYGIDNIRKVNDYLYDCEPKVEYITHDINTKFTVTKGSAIYPYGTDETKYPSIHTYLTQTHLYGDDITSLMNISPITDCSNVDTVDGVGSNYLIPSESSIIYSSKEPLSHYGNYSVRFRNALPNNDTEDYDGNWGMNIKLYDDDEDRLLVNHSYYNFRHKDDGIVINSCDVMDTVWTGSEYSVLNHESMNLRMDNLTPLVQGAKSKTYLTLQNNLEEITYSDGDERDLIINLKYTNYQITTPMPLANKSISLIIESSDGDYKEKITKLTNNIGQIHMSLFYPNGEYTVSVLFEGDDEYIMSNAEFKVVLDYNGTEHYFDYETPTVISEPNKLFNGVLLDTSNNPVPNAIVKYYWGTEGYNEFSAPQMVKTNSDGEFSIPVDFNNGDKLLELSYEGELPCIEIINLTIKVPNNDVSIDVDNYVWKYADVKKISGVIRKNGSTVGKNKRVKIIVYKDTISYSHTVFTDEFGVFKSNEIIIGEGHWYIDVISENCYKTITAEVNMGNTSNTYIEGTQYYDFLENGYYNKGFPDIFYKCVIKNEQGVLQNKLINIEFESNGETHNFEVYSNSEGVITVPILENTVAYLSFEGDMYNSPCSHSVELVFEEPNDDEVEINSVYYIEKHSSQSLLRSLGLEFGYEHEGLGLTLNGADVCIVYNNGLYMSEPNTQTGNKNVTEILGNDYGVHNKDSNILNGGILTTLIDEGVDYIYVMWKPHSSTATYKSGFIKFDISSYVSQQLLDYSILRNTVVDLALTSGDTHRKMKMSPPAFFNNKLIRIELTDDNNVKRNYYTTPQNEYCEIYMRRDELHSNTTTPNMRIYDENDNLLIQGHILKQNRIATEVGVTSDFNLTSTNLLRVTGTHDNKVSQIYGKVYDLYDGTFYEERYNPTAEGNFVIELPLPKNHKYMVYIIYDSFQYASHMEYGVVEGNGTVLSNSFPIIEDKVNPTPDPSDDPYGLVFGSDVTFEIRDRKVSLYDYGMLFDGTKGINPKVYLRDVDLGDCNLRLECEITYGNVLKQRLIDLDGLLQINCIENVDVDSNTMNMYSDMVCSPQPVPDNKCYFTRKSDDGLLYFFSSKNLTSKTKGVEYIGSPYTQYKGGVDLQSEGGISLFNLDNAYSPVILSNGLVRLILHRRGGYVVVERWNDDDGEWLRCNTLKIEGYPILSLMKYIDDKIILKFGEVTISMWRGHPYIELQHKNKDIRIMSDVDRVYCENINERSLGYIEEEDVYCCTFKPNRSLQQFPKYLEIGENINSDRFNIVKTNDDGSKTEEFFAKDLKAEYDIITKDNSLQFSTTEECDYVGLNFPNDNGFVEKPSNNFSLLIEDIRGDTPYAVVCRGFREPVKLNEKRSPYEVGVYYNKVDVTVSNNSLKASFYNVPMGVNYIDFILLYDNSTTIECTLSKIMLYDGDSDVHWEIDKTDMSLATSTIAFEKTYYAKLFNKNSKCGLGIIRPHQDEFTLRYIKGSQHTILCPYLKEDIPQNSMDNLLIEYVNSKEQEVRVLDDDTLRR